MLHVKPLATRKDTRTNASRRFLTREDAHAAYRMAADEMHGEFARHA